ncbi:ferric reductase-like transmembrane domain-containing protein [Ramlibacter sp. AW1]|uniref:Ferric reductase-like transmembrane domain-containing protein n=1 Tax=Ramlibacter aurantiacus TaxID=2801330 RepID=A0A936ZLJ0_9BURK|nr:ferric reductase-like transmembrane domain-containing protein [Ramlibacter aurantiacus]MBL0423102.1 ferric reductase-like transmembrane domain-containing protein [Ramlibacter aurantiacus]
MTHPKANRSSAAPWLGAYLLVVTAPMLLLLLGGSSAPGRGFAWDFSMALGYAALVMFGVQWVLTARFRRATLPFGIDIVYYFHRYLAVCALAIVAVHVGLLFLEVPQALGSADPRRAPAHMTAGRAALVLLATVAVLALARRRLALEYDRWRMTHWALSVTAMVLALWHVFAAGHYLDLPWKRGLWVLFAAAWLAIVLLVRLLRPWRLSRQPWRVAQVRPEHGRVSTLVLEPAAGHRLRFAPGQFAWLTLRHSPWSMHEHPFSIASSATRDDRIELSIKELGDFSRTIKDMKPGETAWLDGPYGTFSIDHHSDSSGFVFIAGGIGIAPVMSMLRTLADRGDRRPLLLVYGNRAWDRVAFREELDQLQQRLDLRVVHVLSEPPAGWTGEHGLITQDLLARPLNSLQAERGDREYFVCGPTAMTQSVEAALAALGVDARRVHSELFEWV